MHRYRTHTCGALTLAEDGAAVRLSGWCHRIRDHGGLLFVDLRDHYGLTQCVVDPDSPAFRQAEKLRSEFVVRVDGHVRKRPPGTENPDMPTGLIEVYVREIEVLGPAGDLPMPVFGDQPYPEDIRLKYRFLDLRREKLHQNIMLRGRIIDSLRARMKAQGFFEFQTPILTASSPEGARDFLVPSRLHPGKFYALPQAPQQFKQLTMVAGFDRYFQIAPCFRDEDARADRSPGEFYQLDIEMSFVTQEDVFAAVEPVLRGVFEEFGGGKPVTPNFPLIPYAEAMLKYGVDKPDLRNPIRIADVTKVFERDDVTFNAFKEVIKAGGVVRAIPAPGASRQPRSFFDKLNDWAKGEGAPGLGYIIFEGGADALAGRGPIAKFLSPEAQKALIAKATLSAGDAVFFSCDKEAKAAKLAGAARIRIGAELGVSKKDVFEFCWIVDFPMFEWNEEEKENRLLPQSLLDAPGRARGSREPGPADHQGLPVRHRLQRRRTVVGRDPQPSPRHHAKGVRDRGLRRGGALREVRRDVPRLPVRRPAAWRHRAWPRPHRHASRRRGEPARSGALPDEPARRGPYDGRAGPGVGEAAARTPYPPRPAGEVAGAGWRYAACACVPEVYENTSSAREQLTGG